jgi:hypothetical protein
MPPLLTLQARFHAEMLAVYDRCTATGFRPVLFRRQVILQGGVKAAKELVFQPGTTGLERLQAAGTPELSMEAAMARPEFAALFLPLEIREAEKRLAGEVRRDRSRGRLDSPVANE